MAPLSASLRSWLEGQEHSGHVQPRVANAGWEHNVVAPTNADRSASARHSPVTVTVRDALQKGASWKPLARVRICPCSPR